MEATNTFYNFEDSLDRIDEILNAGASNYTDSKTIPSRDKLTYTNGYYVYCTAIFVDICGSSDMTDTNKRPVLGKIYRSFISEMVAMFNDYDQCREISINGDCVWTVFETPMKDDIDAAFSAACRAGSLVDVLNFKLKNKKYTTYEVSIGLDYGRALMLKAGYKDSGINDVIWMGDVVNSACHLCSEDRGFYGKRIFLSSVVYKNLCENNKKLCKQYGDKYHSDAVNVQMNNWIEDQNK